MSAPSSRTRRLGQGRKRRRRKAETVFARDRLAKASAMTEVETRPRAHYTRRRPTGKPRKHSWRLLSRPHSPPAPRNGRAPCRRCWTRTGPRWTAGASSRPRWSTRWPGRTCCACCCPKAWAARKCLSSNTARPARRSPGPTPARPGSSTSPTSRRRPSAAAMPHEAAAAMFAGPHAGLAWGARHNNSNAIRVEGGYRLTGTWSFASGGRHTKMAGRPQRRAEPRRHAAHPLRPAGRPQLRLPARAGEDHRRLARARPARHRQRQLLGRGPVRARRACAGARRRRTSGARRGRSIPSARRCSMPAASAA